MSTPEPVWQEGNELEVCLGLQGAEEPRHIPSIKASASPGPWHKASPSPHPVLHTAAPPGSRPLPGTVLPLSTVCQCFPSPLYFSSLPCLFCCVPSPESFPLSCGHQRPHSVRLGYSAGGGYPWVGFKGEKQKYLVPDMAFVALFIVTKPHKHHGIQPLL